MDLQSASKTQNLKPLTHNPFVVPKLFSIFLAVSGVLLFAPNHSKSKKSPVWLKFLSFQSLKI